VTQPTTDPLSTVYVSDEARLLAEILAELREQGAILRRAAAFLDNPVARYRESMRGGKRGRRDTSI
jgi:hypothetical protein